LFNTGYSHEAEVAVGDRQYVIYRYENHLAEDAGLEVFQAEKRLTSADRVDSVFTAEGWQHAFKTLEPERLKAAADVGETAVSFNDPLRTILEALRTVLDLIRQIQSELGRNLWRVVTDRYPQIEEFRDLARETKTTADGWVDASTRLVESLPKLHQGNDRLASAAARDFRGLTPAFYNRFETHVGRVSSNLGTLASIAQELVDPFEYLANRTRNIGEKFEYHLSTVAALDDITDDGSIREPFNKLAAVTEGIPAPIRDFAERVRPLSEHFTSVKSVANGHKRNRMEAWEMRRKADKKVRLLSSGAAFLGVLALAEHWSIPLDTDGDDG